MSTLNLKSLSKLSKLLFTSICFLIIKACSKTPIGEQLSKSFDSPSEQKVDGINNSQQENLVSQDVWEYRRHSQNLLMK